MPECLAACHASPFMGASQHPVGCVLGLVEFLAYLQTIDPELSKVDVTGQIPENWTAEELRKSFEKPLTCLRV